MEITCHCKGDYKCPLHQKPAMTIRGKMARAMVAIDSAPEGSALFDIHWSEFGEGYLSSADAALSVLTNPDDETVERVRLAWEKAKVPHRLSDHEATRLLLAALKEEV